MDVGKKGVKTSTELNFSLHENDSVKKDEEKVPLDIFYILN